MTVVDTRPPLRLTASEAKNWFSLNSHDIGREVVILEWQPAPVSPERIAAGAGFGRWEQGFSGRWPTRTFFARSFLDQPPAWVKVEQDEYGATVEFHVGGESSIYDVTSSVDGRLVGIRR